MFALLHWAADAKDVAFGAATISDDVNLAKKEWTGGNLYVKGDEVIFFIDKWLKYVNRAITGSVWRALHRHVRSIHHQNGSRLKLQLFSVFCCCIRLWSVSNQESKRMTWSEEEISCTFHNIILEVCRLMIFNLISICLRGEVVLVYITVMCR